MTELHELFCTSGVIRLTKISETVIVDAAAGYQLQRGLELVAVARHVVRGREVPVTQVVNWIKQLDRPLTLKFAIPVTENGTPVQTHVSPSSSPVPAGVPAEAAAVRVRFHIIGNTHI